jgi:hypothetical protein
MEPHASSLNSLNDDEKGFQGLKRVHFLKLCTTEKNYLYDSHKKSETRIVFDILCNLAMV